MSLKAMAWALEQKIEAPAVKLLLVSMCEFVNKETDECWPSTKILADTVCIGERSVRRHLRTLEKLGFITTRERKTEAGRQTSNIYKIIFEGGQIGRVDPDTSVPLDPDTSVPPYIEPTKGTEKKEKSPNPADAGNDFLSFSDLMKLRPIQRRRYLTENNLTHLDYNTTLRGLGINPRMLARDAGLSSGGKRTTEEIMSAVFAEDARRKAARELENEPVT